MQKLHQKDKGKPLLAQDARDLILRLIDPGDAQSLHTHCEQEERLQILLYFLKTAGFNASGLKCMAQAGKVATSSQLKDTTVYAIAIREGGVSEVFSLHKKIKVSILQEEDVDEQVTHATRFLSKMSAGRVFDSIHWEESYFSKPQGMSDRPGYAELFLENTKSTATSSNL
jgi:hypothetical protein